MRPALTATSTCSFGVTVALALLERCHPVNIPLTTNCRNTRQILDAVQSTLGADMGVRGTGDGPMVRQCRAASPSEAGRLAGQRHLVA